jgi:hypothetical protein
MMAHEAKELTWQGKRSELHKPIRLDAECEQASKQANKQTTINWHQG